MTKRRDVRSIRFRPYQLEPQKSSPPQWSNCRQAFASVAASFSWAAFAPRSNTEGRGFSPGKKTPFVVLPLARFMRKPSCTPSTAARASHFGVRRLCRRLSEAARPKSRSSAKRRPSSLRVLPLFSVLSVPKSLVSTTPTKDPLLLATQSNHSTVFGRHPDGAPFATRDLSSFFTSRRCRCPCIRLLAFRCHPERSEGSASIALEFVLAVAVATIRPRLIPLPPPPHPAGTNRAPKSVATETGGEAADENRHRDRHRHRFRVLVHRDRHSETHQHAKQRADYESDREADPVEGPSRVVARSGLSRIFHHPVKIGRVLHRITRHIFAARPARWPGLVLGLVAGLVAAIAS